MSDSVRYGARAAWSVPRGGKTYIVAPTKIRTREPLPKGHFFAP